MTMHADQLVGAQVTDSEGLAVGTVEQVFRDDVDGTPSWARIRSSKGLHFIPLTGSNLTSSGGLSVPFDTQKIISEPDLNVDRHMSVEQEEELRRYFDVSVPAQAPAGDDGITSGQPGQAAGGMAAGEAGIGEAGIGEAGTGPAETVRREQPSLADQQDSVQPDSAQFDADGQAGLDGQAGADGQAGLPGQQNGAADQTRPGMASPDLASQTGEPMGDAGGLEWLTRSEERFAVSVETAESGRVKLRKFVDTEPVQETISVYHEEYEIERIPVSADDRQTVGDIAEAEQEVILHEARPIVSKQTVPVERIRLSVRKVEEPTTISGEVRKERVEIDSDASQPGGRRATGR